MSFGNAAAIQADVIFRANYQQFAGDTQQIRAEAQRTFGALDEMTLKSAIASEKYDRALARSQGSSYAVARATAAYKAELAALDTQQVRSTVGAGRHSGALQSEERGLFGVARGAVAGSGALERVGRAAIFASSSVLGGYGLIYATRAVINAAREQQVTLGQLQVALTDSGLSWTQYGTRVKDALANQVGATGFNENDLTASLAMFVRRYGDIDQALRANAIAADVARAKNISLAAAAELVQQATYGNSRSLHALGIDVTKTSSNLDALKASTKSATAEQIANAKAADLQANKTAALDQIQARYHGNAARYLQTDAGKQALFNAELTRSEQIIGQALLPEFNHLLTHFTTYLQKLNDTGRLQHDVNTVMHDGGAVIHDLGGIVKWADGITGGFKNTLELLIGLKVGSVLFGWGVKAIAFEKTLRGLAGAEKAVAEANVATTLTGVGGAATAAEAEVVGLKGSLVGLAALGTIDVPIVITATIVGAGAVGLTSLMHWAGSGIPNVFSSRGSGDPRYAAGNPALIRAIQAAQRQGRNAEPVSWYLQHPALVAQILRGKNTSGMSNDPIHDAARGTSVGATASGKPTLPTVGLTYAEQNALLVAEGTSGTGDDVSVLQRQVALLNAQLNQKGLTEQQRNQVLSARNSALSQLQSIQQQNAQAAASAERARAAAERARVAAQRRRFLALTALPSSLVTRVADAERRDEPASKIVALLQDELHALTRQDGELKRQGAPGSFEAKIAKEQEAIHKQIQSVLTAARKKRIDALDQVPVDLKIEEANAIANNASQERLLGIYRKQKEALDRELVTLRQMHAAKLGILKNREATAAVQKKIDAITKQQKVDQGALARELQDAVAGLAQYAPNVTEALASVTGGPTVHVTQQFPGPPSSDGRREAIYARHAMQAAFDG